MTEQQPAPPVSFATTPRRSALGLVDVSLLGVAIVWGSSYLATKNLVTGDTVVSILVLRFALAGVAMAVLSGPRMRRLEAAELRIGFVLGLILSAIFALETTGVTRTSATNAGLIISLTIVITPLTERVMSGRQLPATFYLATVFAVVGVALLTQANGFTAPSAGDLLMLAAAVVRAVHVVVMHRRSAGLVLDSGRLTVVQLATVTVAFLILSPFIGHRLPATVRDLSGGDWANLVYLALACTVFAFFVQMWAVRRTSPSRVSLLLGTEPVWAAVIGISFAHNRLTVVGVIGAVLILAGINWARTLEQRSHPAATPTPEATELG